MKAILAFCLITGSALSANAEDLFRRPEGCTLMATAQYSNCELASTYSCGTGDAAFFRIEGYAADDPDTVIHETPDHALIVSSDAEGNVMTVRRSSATNPRDVMRSGTGQIRVDAMFAFEGADLPVSFTQDMTYAGVTVQVQGHSLHRIESVTTLIYPGLDPIPGTITFGYMPETDLLVRLESRHEIPGKAKLITLKSLSLPGEDGAGEVLPQFGCEQQGGLAFPLAKVRS